MKINLEKCIFGNKEVSYVGFTLTPEGIKPGKNKLKAIETAKTPADVKTIRSFVGLCNFWTHIKNFAIGAAPLFKLTRKDSGYKGGPLPEEAKAAFVTLRKQLISEPVMAFPRLDRQYALITDAATGTADTPGGLGAILTQVDKDGKFYAISFASRQLKDHEKNYSPFLLEAAAAPRGNGPFQRISKRKEVHPVHGPQTTRETGPPPQQNHESIPDGSTRARLRDPVQKRIRHASRLPVKTSSFLR